MDGCSVLYHWSWSVKAKVSEYPPINGVVCPLFSGYCGGLDGK